MFLRTFLTTSILTLAVITANGCHASPPSPYQLRGAAVTLSRPNGNIFCTGVAVGKNTILTNQHCLRGESTILYNGKSCPADKVVAFDGGENVLVRTCQTYKSKRRISRLFYPIGEKVSHYGHPYGLQMMYREGVLVMKGEGEDFKMPAGKVYIFDMNATGGDSGGPVYDKAGRVICTISFGIHAFGDGFTVTACYVPAFTKEQLKEIR